MTQSLTVTAAVLKVTDTFLYGSLRGSEGEGGIGDSINRTDHITRFVTETWGLMP